jgi:phosphopantothenoylcysteine decarboxylase
VDIVVTGAGPVNEVCDLIDQALSLGWSLRVIATPAARKICASSLLEEIQRKTRHPVVDSYDQMANNKPDAVIVAPCTVNTLSKLAQDIRDTYAHSYVGTMIAAETIVVVLPSVKLNDTKRDIFRENVSKLQREGVFVLLFGEDGIHPTNKSGKTEALPPFPWHLAISKVRDCLSVIATSPSRPAS